MKNQEILINGRMHRLTKQLKNLGSLTLNSTKFKEEDK